MDFMYTLRELLKEYISFLSDVVIWLICICIGFIFLFALCVIIVRRHIRKRSAGTLTHLRKNAKGERTCVIGFFHPYCNAGGGGERVLWMAIQSLQRRFSNVRCVVYTGDFEATTQSILDKARDRFNITLTQPVEFIFLRRRSWVEAYRYPFLTLLGQSLGSIFLGWEALMAFVPDIYVDSMGYAFTIPLFRYFGGCKVGCYVHYPTISTDMLNQVSQRNESYNNRSFISRSVILSFIKLQYYRLFAYLYGVAGKKCHFIMVNSTWTYGHIKQLWKAPDKTNIVYPPCNIKEFMEIPLKEEFKHKNIISIAQFRPEKNHPLQVRSFHKFLTDMKESERSQFKLLLVGSCRNADDQNRVKDLEALCKELDISNYVEFKLNVSFQELKNLISDSLIGLHTMWNEHFGIGIVELMAAGTVMVAHNSGGPKLDIVVPLNNHITGFLADDEESYAAVLSDIIAMSPQKLSDIRRNARESVNRFSDSEFEHGFLSVIGPFIQVDP